jgi:hypothetical protein
MVGQIQDVFKVILIIVTDSSLGDITSKTKSKMFYCCKHFSAFILFYFILLSNSYTAQKVL